MRTTSICFLACLALSYSHAQPLCDFQGKDSLAAIVVGDTIHINDFAACAYCSATFNIWVNAVNDSIYIVQTDTAGRIATCDCLFNLRTSISGLPPGTYWIAVYRDLLKKYGYFTDIHQFIGSVQVVFQPTSTPSLAWNTFQSQCLPNAVPPEASLAPARPILHQNYPNPFNAGTTIRYRVARSSMVRLSVFDLLGREVMVLVNERRDAGIYEVRFDRSDLPSGVYFYTLTTGSVTQARRLVLLR